MMIILPSAQDVIDVYREAGRPLDEDLIADLNYVVQQLADEGLESSFAILKTKCRVCNYEMVIIVPVIADLENLECANCENMSVMEEDDLEDVPDYGNSYTPE